MKFAKRMERMQASEIRELLKLTAQPDIISLQAACPHRNCSRLKKLPKFPMTW